jgi:UDP-glucuronate 4-epimerase
MKVVITGASGAIGSHLAERLLDAGYTVYGIDAYTSYYDPRIKRSTTEILKRKGVRMFELDLAHDDLSAVLKGTDVVVHLAAQPGISATTSFSDYVTNNILATEALLSAVTRLDTLQHFINGSTSSVYGLHADGDEVTEPKPVSHYGVTKLAAEQLVMARYRRDYFPATSLRFFSVYGERERPDKFFSKLIRAIHFGHEVPFHEGSERHVRSYSYVGDIIDGCMQTLSAPEKSIGEIFNLGTDQTVTTGEALSIVETLMGSKAQKNILPPRKGDQRETAANIDKIRRVLGYTPRTHIRDGLTRQIEWFRTQPHSIV